MSDCSEYEEMLNRATGLAEVAAKNVESAGVDLAVAQGAIVSLTSALVVLELTVEPSPQSDAHIESLRQEVLESKEALEDAVVEAAEAATVARLAAERFVKAATDADVAAQAFLDAAIEALCRCRDRSKGSPKPASISSLQRKLDKVLEKIHQADGLLPESFDKQLDLEIKADAYKEAMRSAVRAFQEYKDAVEAKLRGYKWADVETADESLVEV